MVCEIICSKLYNRVELYIGNDDDHKKISEVEQKRTHAKHEEYATKVLALFVTWLFSKELIVGKTSWLSYLAHVYKGSFDSEAKR